MAFWRASRSLRSLQRQAVTGLDGLQASSQILRHPQKMTKQYFSNVNSRSKGSPFCGYDSIAQERFCTIPSRAFVTSYKGVLDGEEKASPSRPNMPPETSENLNTVAPTEPGNETPSVSMAVDSAFKASPRHDMALLFTCTVCDVRSAKTMSRATYETGVVIVRCPGCQNLHLIADRYGWFGEPGSVEDFLAEKGIDVRKGSDSSYEFTVDDMSGWTPKGKSEQ